MSARKHFVCTLDDCERQHYARGFCNTHWQQDRRTVGPPCSGPECERPVSARGLCNAHYMQLQSGSDLRPLFSTRRPDGISTVRDEAGNKECAQCRAWLPESAFNKTVGRPDGLRPQCRECGLSAYDPEEHRFRWMKRRYGLTQEDYEAKLASQGGVCAACGTSDPGAKGNFAVDHDHSCCPGKDSCGTCVRGLLCSGCNTGLGHFKDDPERLIAAAAYLISFRKAEVPA